MNQQKTVKAYIWDLGAVLIALDVPRALAQFAALSGQPEQAILTLVQQNPLFKDFEKGLIGQEAFRQGACQLLGTNLPAHTFDQAWNSMLGRFYTLHMDWLLQLRAQGAALYLLSNTNSIHLQQVNQILLQDTGQPNLNYWFDHCYYSFEMGLRKPNAPIFEKVLQNHGLDPAQTLFIDDTQANIATAQKLGLQVLHATSPQALNAHFDTIVT